MNQSEPTKRYMPRRPAGVALIIAVVVLVVLSSLLAALSVRITMVKRRQEYRLEYQRARYALDSAMKYALSVLPEKAFALSSREGKPDFSDLFWMTPEQYTAFLGDWVMQATDEQIEGVLKEGASLYSMPSLSPEEMLGRLTDIFGAASDDPNTAEEKTDSDTSETLVEIDPNDIVVPGPYGPPWPYVIKPIELEIGTAKVTITVEDENAKMPLAWAITNREAVNKQAEAVLATFCDWMGMEKAEQEALQAELAEVYKYKMFELNPSPILLPPIQAPAPAQPAAQTSGTSSFRTSRTRTQPARTAPAPVQVRPAVAAATDFAKLFHSALLDRQALARPMRQTALPDESPIKYLALWGSQRVNVNTAPRQVLEAALTFGGDPVELVEKIIQMRQQKPIKTIEELKSSAFGDSQMIERAKDYLTTTSNFFMIRVVSQSGNARATAVATVIKEGKTMERLAILYGQ